jgi:serine/threonine-protein kinase
VPAVAPPKQLGKYEVGAKIGGGGMATVYVGRALRDDGSEERVALKVIRDELAHDENFRSMFIDEAKILARLSHPNVIQTLEYGLTGHHRFIAMELLSGRTYYDVWEHLVANGERMPVRLSAWICARVAEGLHSAHELVDETGHPLGVIHRDVNPGNVFLTHAGEVKLIDFGLAKARKRLSRSEDGIVKGKIPYLAPEQAHGLPIDRRIDVYALGATLWESVTMKRLFKRDTDVDTLRAIRDAHVPDVRTMVDGVSDELWGIIERSLRRARDERYATSDDLRAALDAYVGEGMKEELAALLTRLFPGQEARQARWERAATSVRVAAHTMPPPAPVPTASSSMLEDDGEANEPSAVPAEEEEAPPSSAPASSAPERSDGGSTVSAPSERESTAPTAPTPSSPALAGPTTKKHGKHAKNQKKKKKHASKSQRAAPPAAPPSGRASAPPASPASSRRRQRRDHDAPPAAAVAPPEAPRRTWVTVAVVIAVALAVALLFSAR